MGNDLHANGIGTHHATSLLTGLSIGGLVGFGVLMLLAPQSGKENRAWIHKLRVDAQELAVAIFGEMLTLSHYDNRQILVETRQRTEIRK